MAIPNVFQLVQDGQGYFPGKVRVTDFERGLAQLKLIYKQEIVGL
jgi:hypothetical protein